MRRWPDVGSIILSRQRLVRWVRQTQTTSCFRSFRYGILFLPVSKVGFSAVSGDGFALLRANEVFYRHSIRLQFFLPHHSTAPSDPICSQVHLIVVPGECLKISSFPKQCLQLSIKSYNPHSRLFFFASRIFFQEHMRFNMVDLVFFGRPWFYMYRSYRAFVDEALSPIFHITVLLHKNRR